MAMLVESISKPLQVKSGKKLTGPFTVLGVFNQNGRRYSEDVFMEAYEELVPKIKDRRLLGELDHPLEYDEVRLINVSHVITECHMTTDNRGHKVVSGTVELLDTPSGKIAQALVKAGIPLGISSRAVGNTKKVAEGVDVTQLKLITYDLVAEPSFATAILSEEKKAELAESLCFIESRLPLNESKDTSNIRTSIHRIRESLCLPETKSGAAIHIDKSLKSQTLEIEALKSLLESNKSVISKDTKRLKETRAEIKRLKSVLSESVSRYKGLKENHQRLQDSYNSLQESCKREDSKKVRLLKEEVVDLRKRLAVEQRGMSYENVRTLLEGTSTFEEINSKLDSLTSMRRKSNVVSKESLEGLNESITVNSKCSKLSSIIGRI